MKTALTIRNNNNNSSATFIIRIAALIIVTIFTFCLKAKCADSTNVINKKNAAYVSFTTQGTPSLNYERIFRQGHTFSYSYSAGFSFKGKNIYAPLSVNAITNAKQHHLEISLGVTPFSQEHFYAKGKTDMDKQVTVRPSIGYRYQKAAGGIFIKAGIGPNVLIDPPAYNVAAITVSMVKPSAQLAIGFGF